MVFVEEPGGDHVGLQVGGAAEVVVGAASEGLDRKDNGKSPM